MNEDKLLVAQAEDIIARCESKDIPVCGEFLDARQQSLLRQTIGTKRGDVSIVYCGGYEDADRVIMVCLPYYMESARMSDFLAAIRLTVPKRSMASVSGRKLTHSDYLGAVMGLGIRRSVIGDIIVTEDGADIIAVKEMAEYLLRNITGVGKAHIQAEEISLHGLRLPQAECTQFTDTVASLRLDAVLASAFRISRGKAAEAIKQGLVFVDHLEASRVDIVVSEGANLVIRHRGKAKLLEVGKRTRKGRTYITVARY